MSTQPIPLSTRGHKSAAKASEPEPPEHEPTAWERLREPFPPEKIGKLPRSGVTLDYVGHADVTDRLLAVDPLWTWEPMALDEHGLPLFVRNDAGKPVGLWIRLTVNGHTRLGFGSVMPGAFDAEKQLIGDAIRNAAMRFGVALDLWRKEETHAEAETPAAAPHTPAQRAAQWRRVPIEGHACPDCGEGLVAMYGGPQGTGAFVGHAARSSSCKWKPDDERRTALFAAAPDPERKSPPDRGPDLLGMLNLLSPTEQAEVMRDVRFARRFDESGKPLETREQWVARLTSTERAALKMRLDALLADQGIPT